MKDPYELVMEMENCFVGKDGECDCDSCSYNKYRKDEHEYNTCTDMLCRDATLTVEELIKERDDAYQSGFDDGYDAATHDAYWIPIKYRPMEDNERQNYETFYGYELDDDEALMFDCPMPENGEEIWVCSKNGYVWQDVCRGEEGFYLEENGDWEDIIAWMPHHKPNPYKGE